MATYRIKIEKIEGGVFTHLNNFMVNDIAEIIKAITDTDTFQEKLEERTNRMMEKKRREERKRFFESDLFDSHAVGKDISNDEYLDNEIFFETKC